MFSPINLFKSEGFSGKLPDIQNAIEATVITELSSQKNKLENKLSKTRKTVNTDNVTINDLKKSRENWKQKVAKINNKVAELEQKNGY